jgi:hypothetical protein
VRYFAYEDLAARRRLPGGAYVFADLDIADRATWCFAAQVAARIDEAAPDARVLNDPRETLGRYELLRRLHREGVNDFDAIRADECRLPGRWPVFLRGERDHDGPVSGLLADRDALEAALWADRRAGCDPRRRLVVEFRETRDADGLYRKYAACRVGDAVFPRHLLFGRDWMVKLQEPPEASCLAEEREFVEGDPDAAEVQRLFDLAGVAYGRIDYAKADGRILVWEINSNPMIVDERTRRMRSRWELNRVVIARHAAAMLQLAEEAADRPSIPLAGIARRPWWRRGRRAETRR